jgi:penicillin amidase
MQLDDFAYNASNIIPKMIEWVKPDELAEKEMEVLELMADWDFMMEAELIQPTVYLTWRNRFYRAVFNDEYNATEASLRYPSRDIFVEIIKEEPDMAFVDDINTPEKETVEDIVTRAFKETIASLVDYYGEDIDNWKWGYDIDNDLNHIANIPGFGIQNIFNSGAAEAINAVRGTHGPSWRMVVELGPEVKGWGVYPGGQSGNPGSPNYDDMVEDWRTGRLFELNFLHEEPEEYEYVLRLSRSEG